MRWVFCVLLVLLGCSLQEGGVMVHGGPDTSGEPDTSIVDASLPDKDQQTADVSRPCDPSKPFGTPVGESDVDTAGQNIGLTFFLSGLGASFSSTRPGGLGNFDVFLTSRASGSAALDPAVNAGAINSPWNEYDDMVSEDGLMIYFTTDRTARTQIYQASRLTVNAPFGAPLPALFIATAGANDYEPFINRDGSSLYFASDRGPNPGNTDLYRADLNGSFFGTPVALSELSVTGTSAATPVLTQNELTIYFASTRPAPKAMGNHDVWVARRAAKTDPFGAPSLVVEVNSSGVDAPSAISSDGCNLYLTSDRAGGAYQVYRATKPQ